MKIGLIIVALNLASIGAFAQSPSFGIKAGLNLAKYSIKVSANGMSGSADSNNLTGFMGGFYATFKASEMFSIQPELLYSGQGGSSSSGDLKLGYINVPLMLRYNATPNFSLQAGPQLGFLISATGGGTDVRDQFNGLDLSIPLGFGFDTESGFNGSFRYIIGLTNMAKVDLSGSGLSGVDFSVTNQVLQFSLGYRLSQPTAKE